MVICKLMQRVVLASAIFLVTGVAVEIVVQATPFAAPSVFPALLSALAAFSVLFAATLLAVTFLFSLLPRIVRQLSGCEH